MSLMSGLIARMYRLPPRRNAVTVIRDLEVPADDGIVLMTDRYAPRKRGTHPTLLIRLPYGRRNLAAMAEAYAERGYNTLMQACRGTGGSGGIFDPLVHERSDGLATLAWIREQPWFDGRLGLTGPSYMGFAQWAICDALPPGSAMSTKVTSAEFESVVFPGGSFHLGLWLSWMQTIEGLRNPGLRFVGDMMSGAIERATRKAANHLPLVDADKVAMGREVPFWRDWIQKAVGNHEFWASMDHRKRLGAGTPPNHFVSGWQDFMVDQLLRDFAALVEAGQRPYLTIGSWTHVDNELQAESMRQTLVWMDAHLLAKPGGLRKQPVRLHISGADKWIESECYPPDGMSASSFRLHPESALDRGPPPDSTPSRFVYDPSKPTPSVGGAKFAFTGAGPQDTRSLERRKDVLCFTSQPLDAPLTVVGSPTVTLFARSSLQHADFFVSLNDVAPDGRSLNMTDAIRRIAPGTCPPDAEGIWRIELQLHAVGHQFDKGHRLRVLVASGAHPRFARNLGTGEQIATATAMRAATQEVFHDPGHPSAITLPIYRGL
ncbi:MAG TPA: CocE/NonD family hydrolase [Devosiaceae bacterium]